MTQTLDGKAELDLIRAGVSCAALLEGYSSLWRFDARESTRRAKKYRRGKGEVLIVQHDDRGWFDPGSAAMGDVFDLVQFLDPSLNFGHVRQVLRRFIGIAPSHPPMREHRTSSGADASVAKRWQGRPVLRPGSPAWTYLTETRGLPAEVLAVAARLDVVREGVRGSAWFAHRTDGYVTHVEARGSAFRSSLRGGNKTLFRFAGDHADTANAVRSGNPPRLTMTEAPIDALSLAAIEGMRADTIYVATGGGMGPATVEALRVILAGIAQFPDAELASATDNDLGGARYADRHAELAATAGVRFVRLRPTAGNDWNDTLRFAHRQRSSDDGLPGNGDRAPSDHPSQDVEQSGRAV